MPFSKSELQTLYSIDLEQVNRNLEASGLDLNKDRYEDWEINERFDVICNYFKDNPDESIDRASQYLQLQLRKNRANGQTDEIQAVVDLLSNLSPAQAEIVIQRIEARGSAISDRLTIAFENGLISQLCRLAQSGELDRRISKSLGESQNAIDIEIVDRQQNLLQSPEAP